MVRQCTEDLPETKPAAALFRVEGRDAILEGLADRFVMPLELAVSATALKRSENTDSYVRHGEQGHSRRNVVADDGGGRSLRVQDHVLGHLDQRALQSTSDLEVEADVADRG